MFGKLKQQRRISTRYDKSILSFESFVNFAAVPLSLKSFVNAAWQRRARRALRLKCRAGERRKRCFRVI